MKAFPLPKEALHHGAEHVLLAHDSAVEEGQSGAAHHQHQGGRDEHPGVVAGGLRGGDGGGLLGHLLLQCRNAV
jgi:hypothetical protein